ncbi:hypothetical protein VP1G_08517 [Cytospora mali]|uniref:Uncharacterized protein n=1 Tax=Cytospora mali TaxID=578113 RepID=A0A194VC18_CYTMA|nr:hypothetical protein VP1G_08517 [Valsa mali var. pyri (nom. inval.)]
MARNDIHFNKMHYRFELLVFRVISCFVLTLFFFMVLNATLLNFVIDPGLSHLYKAIAVKSDYIHTLRTEPFHQPSPTPAPALATTMWTTSTIYSTSIYTVVECPSTVNSCPASSTVTTTTLIPVTTTVCPVTTQTGHLNQNGPEVTPGAGGVNKIIATGTSDSSTPKESGTSPATAVVAGQTLSGTAEAPTGETSPAGFGSSTPAVMQFSSSSTVESGQSETSVASSSALDSPVTITVTSGTAASGSGTTESNIVPAATSAGAGYPTAAAAVHRVNTLAVSIVAVVVSFVLL